MNPEQRLLIILEYLAVKFQIFFFRAFIRMLCPKRSRLVQEFRPLCNFQFLLILFLFFLDLFYDGIRIQLFFCLDNLRFCRICFGQINFRRHKGTVFFYNLPCLIFVAEFQAVLVDIEGDFRPDLSPASLFHIKFRSPVALPMHRLCSLFIRKRINVYLVRYHKCGIKAKAEVSDNLVLIRLVLILFKKVRRPGKSDLIDIFLHLVRRHADPVINKFQRLFFRVDHYFYFRLVVIRQNTFSHHFQFFPLCNRVASVGNHFPHENVMVGIQPFFDNRKNIIAVY